MLRRYTQFFQKMNDATKQPKLLGFAGQRGVGDSDHLREMMRREVIAMRDLIGRRMIAITSAAAGADGVFLKTCVELRVPVIVILPDSEARSANDNEDSEEWAMTQRLCSVALAKYVFPSSHLASDAYDLVTQQLLEWADAFLFVCNGEPQVGAACKEEAVKEARDLGIPSRIINVMSHTAKWEIPPDPSRKARHGFDTRADLLDFLDARFQSQSERFWRPGTAMPGSAEYPLS